jgi:predicted rRNA methylase YqxC with S4 and FtsJ domains
MGMNIMYRSHYSRHFAQHVKIEIAIIMSKISINSFYNWKPVSILSSKRQARISKQQAERSSGGSKLGHPIVQACPVVQACPGVVGVVRAVE